MFETAPQELLLALRDIYGLDFVPVPCRTRDELDAALTVRGVPLGTWASELWEEYLDYDSILACDGEGNIHRFIWTMTFLVVRERPKADNPALFTREALKERVEWPDGSVTERKFNNTMSEKLRWRRKGIWIHRFVGWRPEVVRTFWEELGVQLTRQFLKYPWLARIDAGVRYFKDPETGQSGVIDVKGVDPKRPEVTTHNRLFHFFLKLHQPFWKDEYREPKYRHGRLIKTMIHAWGPAEDLDRTTND